jgi:hypothetical protein
MEDLTVFITWDFQLKYSWVFCIPTRVVRLKSS